VARTSDAAVAAIAELDSSISLAPFIEAASAMVDVNCEALNPDYTATELELIERWLAAHCYHIRDMRAEQEKAGSVGSTYQSKVDLGLDVTHYGQMAMRLDYYGGLAALNERIKDGRRGVVSLTYLGKTRDE